MNTKKFDVIIVGGGIIGCSVAYYLTRSADQKLKIAVIEKNKVGEEASSGAAGMIAAQIETDSPGPFLDLALQSRSMFESLSAELNETSGVDIEFARNGIASIAFNKKDETILKKRSEWQKKSGLNCEWLNSENILKQFPFIRSESLCGFYAPEDGQVSANRLTTAFFESVKKSGVLFFEGEPVKPPDLISPNLNALETTRSKFLADKFIFTPGAWTGFLFHDFIPVKPVKGQILIFEMPKKWREKYSWKTPIYIGTTEGLNPIHCYLVPKKDGHLFLGATMEECGFDKSENKNAGEKMSEYACKIFPELESFPYKGVWTGFRPGSPDRMPVLGLVPKTKNVYIASGHFRNGILLAPVTGKIISELILSGKSSIPIDSFSPERFLKYQNPS